jgi:hypothetical protein
MLGELVRAVLERALESELMAREATHGTLAIQLRDIERQAGVRRTL